MLLAAIGGAAARVPAVAWIVAGTIAAAALWVSVERASAAHWRHAAATAEAGAAVLRGQVGELADLNQANAAELVRIRQAHERVVADLATDLDRARKAGTRLTVIHQEIARDPDAAAPLADRCPALDRFLDRLLDDRGGAATGDADRAGGDPAPAGPAGMPAGAAGTAAAADDRPGPRLDRGPPGGRR